MSTADKNGAEALYDTAIKDLAAKARDLGPVEDATCRREQDNFLCGDRITLDVVEDDGTVTRIGAKVRGCLLVQAAAALLAETAPGRDRDVLKAGIEQVRALLAEGTPATGDWEGLNAFTPVHGHRHRHDCVLLPFQALAACLEDKKD